ncbi:hypothetical protein [Lacticaseibacillus parakribbianus]|uniref:hypothetical protein n=1 Tax=Lacticaseibacillus parakribbianus TaxID=2970927 RepID=UPI0021CB4A23|nr:hypothetical protein [Lacticaseibacillus parakribbianus]
MIEQTMKQFLDGRLAAPSFFEVPADAPDQFILIERTGGASRNHLSSGTFAFQSYAGSLYDAANLNEQVKEAVEAMIELDDIRSVSLNSDYNFTDTTTKKYRYQAVFDVGYY